MATPTPNGPTINDLQYQSFATPAPYGYSPQLYDQTVTNEKVTLNFVGYTATDIEQDITITSEYVNVTIDTAGPNQYSIITADSTKISEVIGIVDSGQKNLIVSDSSTTSESVTATEA